MADYIIDLGAYESVFGIAGENIYQGKIRMVYADSDEALLAKGVFSALNEMAKERLYGDTALKYKTVLEIRNILKDENLDAFCNLIKEQFEKNYLDPRDYGLLLLVPPNFPMFLKDKLQEIIFRDLEFQKLSFIPHGMCVLTNIGKNTGTIIDIGAYSTRIEGYFKGFPNEESKKELSLGGNHVTERLIQLIRPKLNFTTSIPLDFIAEQIKHNHVKCELDPEENINSIQKGESKYSQEFQLPDGSSLFLDRELFECSEIFFNPGLAHIHSKNLVQLILESIRAWDRSNVPDLVKNIYLCGNGSNIPGLKEKIQLLLEEFFPENLGVKITQFENPKDIFWKGASVLYIKKKENLEWIHNPFTKKGEDK